MSLTRTTADAVLKDDYLPGLRGTLNNKVFLLSQIEANEEDVEGRAAVLAIHTGRNEGVGARAELGTLPTAGRQAYQEQRVTLKYNYGSIKISGPTIRSMGSDTGSFVRAVQSETEGVVRDLKDDINRQLYGDGSGALAPLTSAASSTTVTVTNATKTQMRNLRSGMVVDIGTLANPTSVSSGRTIASVDRSAGTFVVDSAVTVASNCFVFRTGSGGTGASQKEVTGLDAQIAATGELWNIDPATVEVWKSYVDDNGGAARATNEDLYIQAAQEVNVETGENLDLWITTSGVHRRTAALLTSIKRFPNSLELKGGYKGLDMSSTSQGMDGANETAMVFDKHCPKGTAFGLTKSRIQWYRMSDWEFMDEDGSVLNRVSGQDAYEATAFIYAELATDNRAAHARINDITDDAL